MEDFFGGQFGAGSLGGVDLEDIDVYVSIFTRVYLCFVTCFLVILF